MQKRGLGKGLAALIPTAPEAVREIQQGNAAREISVERITPSPFQPRRTFDEAKIDELAASIRNQGIIQPLVVRPRGDGFELIAGERRRLSFAMPAITKRCSLPWWKTCSAKI
jgi:ParB family chromosome partitioning protein